MQEIVTPKEVCLRTDFFQDEQTKRPRERGLNDPKLGPLERNQFCVTCGESHGSCPGHFGHIELAVPVFHIGLYLCRARLQLSTNLEGFLTKIKKLLETVCHNCGKILVDEVSEPLLL